MFWIGFKKKFNFSYKVAKKIKQEMLQLMYPLNKIIISVEVPTIVTQFPNCFERLDTSDQFIFTVNKANGENYGGIYGQNNHDINIEMNNLPHKQWEQKIWFDESNNRHSIVDIKQSTNLQVNNIPYKPLNDNRELGRLKRHENETTRTTSEIIASWSYGTQSKQAITINKLPKHMPVYAYKVIKLITIK